MDILGALAFKTISNPTTVIVYFQTETLFPSWEMKSIAIVLAVRIGSICETFMGIVEVAGGWLTFAVFV